MALFYYKTKMNLWVKGEKKVMYVAKQHIQGTHDEDYIAEKLTKSLSMEAPEVLLAMDELTDQITSAVLSGQSVKVEGLGTFSPSLKTVASESPEDANTEKIQKVKINFRPDAKLKREMEDASVKYYNQLNTNHI